MIRISILLLALLLLASTSAVAMAASPRTAAAKTQKAVAIPTATPSPQAPTAGLTSGSGTAQNAAAAVPQFEPAPLPNQDLFAPVQRANEDPQVNPALFRPSTQFRGDGVLPGSSAQSYEERHLMPAAGLNLNVPLK
jgi:hypothetical protein